jgi:uncharacterized RDD family membrane protein YckC
VTTEWSAPDPGPADPPTVTPAVAERPATPATPSVAPAAASATTPEAGSPYAGLATRALALAVDAVVINGVALLVAIVVGLSLSIFDIPNGTEQALVELGALLTVIWVAAYFVLFWSANGQTPGNRLMEIRVLDARTGRPPRQSRALLRVILLELSALLLFIPTLLVLVDSRRRALHDRLARTVVVYAPAAVEDRRVRRRSAQQ